MKCTPVSEEDGRLLMRGECPNCHQKGLLAGPRGGACQNMVCPVCASEYNVGPFAGMCESLGVASPERLCDVYSFIKTAVRSDITVMDAKWLDPACHQGCQSLVFKGRIEQLETALRELDRRVHTGYDFNADPDKITLLVGKALRGET